MQKVPSSHNRPRGIQDTTCRHSDCPNKVTPPTSYRASLEKFEDCDPAHNVIGYEAVDSLKNVRKTPKGSQGRRGLGANGQEWWCLKCLEALFVHLRECVLKHKPDGSTLSVHPLTSIQYWIIPERRTIPQFEGAHYTLQSPQIHLIGKWQAVKTYDELRNHAARGNFDLPEDTGEDAITLYLGRDGESFYLDTATRDIQGVLADNKVCEIDASNVRGYSLSEALRRLDKKEDGMVEAKWKPIMAARREAEASEEPNSTYGQQAGSSKKRGEEARPEHQGEGIEANSPILIEANSPLLEESGKAMPIIYVGNEPPEKTRKRKRDSPRDFVPLAPTLACPQKTVKKRAQTHAAPHRVRPQFVYNANAQDQATPALRSTGIYPSEGVPSPSIGPTQAGVRGSTRVEERSPLRVNNLDTKHKSDKRNPRADAYGRKIPIALASQKGMSPSARPATQPFVPPKYAPNPLSRLCNKTQIRVTKGAEMLETQKEQPGD